MHSSSIYNSQDMEIAQVSIDSWMDEEDIIYMYTHTHTHTHSGILLSHKKNEINPFTATWVGPTDRHTTFSVNQTEKDKYHVVLLICGI